MSRLFKMLTICLLLVLLCCMPAAFAAEQPALPDGGWLPEPETVITEESLTRPTRDNTVYYSTIEEAAAQMRPQLTTQQADVVVNLKWPSYDSTLHEMVWDAAKAHTGVSNEGDAIAKVFGGYSVSISRYLSGGYYYITFNYHMSYLTTPAQEVALQSAIEDFVAKNITPGMSDYEKFCVIYDWMCANITYDYDTLNDSTYKLKYTAYAAMFNKTAVCQGYAVLLYRMLLESGVDCRVITGIGNGGGHAWNIVKIDGLYYNTDSTWDATWYQALGYYDFCLQCEENFTDNYTDHFRDAEYDTAAFHQQYVMSATDYDPATSGAAPKIEIALSRMILGNALKFQFGIPKSALDSWTGAYALIEKEYEDGTIIQKTLAVSRWGTAKVSGEEYWSISYDGLAAKEMADRFYVTIYNADNEPISETRNDSVRAYVERAFSGQSSEGKTLLVDMLNYGAVAQQYFGYNTDDLANNGLTASQKSYGTQTVATLKNNQVKGTNYFATRFILKSSIQVQVAFNGLTDDMYAIYTYTTPEGYTAQFRVEGKDFVTSGSIRGVELSKLVYADARSLVTVQVYKANGTLYATAKDSIESCAFRSTNGDDVFIALMKFADSAKAYLY